MCLQFSFPLNCLTIIPPFQKVLAQFILYYTDLKKQLIIFHLIHITYHYNGTLFLSHPKHAKVV